MYIDFQNRHFDTPTVESAMSRREGFLLSLFTHLALMAFLLIVPRLQFVQDAANRRAERLAEIAEVQAELVATRAVRDEPRFIFVEPLVDTPAPVPVQNSDLSDLDRVAQSPLQAEIPENNLPNADGNTFEFVESITLPTSVDPTTPLGAEQAESAERLLAGESSEGGGEEGEAEIPEPEMADAGPGEGRAPTEALSVRADPGRSRDPADERSGTILNQALRGLDNVARRQSFHNATGRTDLYGPDIQFDSKGVDFGSWIRRFRAQIYRNWFIPYAAMSMSGNVVLTFNVHKDGSLTDLTIQRPSAVDAFTNSAYGAMRGSNPTYPLPPEYPDDFTLFTVTFYFNEPPPGRY